jgi:hypothetical protein
MDIGGATAVRDVVRDATQIAAAATDATTTRAPTHRRIRRDIDVLDLLLADVLEAHVERPVHLLAHRPRHADPARLGEGLQPRGDVDPVARDVARLDHDVAEIDPDPVVDSVFRRNVGIARGHLALDLHRGSQSRQRARELGEQPVAGGFDDATAVRQDRGIDDLAADSAQPGKRSRVVALHQPRVTDDIRNQDRGEAAFNHGPARRVHRWSCGTVRHCRAPAGRNEFIRPSASRLARHPCRTSQ